MAAADNLGAVRQAQNAAFAIWGGTTVIIGAPMLLLRHTVSVMLTGSGADAWAVTGIVLLCSASGPAQIYASVLTGRQNVVASLAAQAAGLTVGSAVALAFLQLGRGAEAALAFSSGPVLTAGIGWLLVRKLDLPTSRSGENLGTQVSLLLRYSSAFFVATFVSAGSLFVLRYIYREHFGVNALGVWLVANRVSDLGGQLLGLFMAQSFLPGFVSSPDEATRRRFILRSFGIGTAAMVAPLVVFSIEPRALIHLFLSDKYLPAARPIIAYMIGDVLRVSAAIALQVALARRRMTAFVGMEMGIVSLFAAMTVAGIVYFGPSAPFIAQVTTQAGIAVLAWIVFWRSGVGATSGHRQ